MSIRSRTWVQLLWHNFGCADFCHNYLCQHRKLSSCIVEPPIEFSHWWLNVALSNNAQHFTSKMQHVNQTKKGMWIGFIKRVSYSSEVMNELISFMHRREMDYPVPPFNGWVQTQSRFSRPLCKHTHLPCPTLSAHAEPVFQEHWLAKVVWYRYAALDIQGFPELTTRYCIYCKKSWVDLT